MEQRTSNEFEHLFAFMHVTPQRHEIRQYLRITKVINSFIIQS
jgi:hypothetical protein